MKKTVYLTTPLYYVNAAPHIGHSYTEVAVDCLARFHRLKGESVFFLTGTDEHGQKIEQAARMAKLPPEEFVEGMVENFKNLWKLLRIEPTHFIRTTDKDHEERVKKILTRLVKSEKVRVGDYQGWYCTPCETYWTLEELGGIWIPSPPCLSCGRPMEEVKEKGWYLPLEDNRKWLLKFLAEHTDFIQPVTKFNEIYSILKQDIPPWLWITRPRQRVSWGIEVPPEISSEHVIYVWFDALLNYITAIGYPDDMERFHQYWPADLHMIGKDILRHHAIYWPLMLHALGFPDEAMPRMIFAHGWWKVGEQKMSKSLGNIVDPTVVVGQLLKGQPYAADIYRYFLLREVPFGQDGAFSEEALAKRLSSDLANDLGNLVNRTCSMIERYRQGGIPPLAPEAERLGWITDDNDLKNETLQLNSRLSASMANLNFSEALEAIFHLVRHANRYIEAQMPWQYAKDPTGKNRVDTTLHSLAETIRVIAITVEPFMPSVANAIWQQLGFGSQSRRLQDTLSWPGVPDNQRIGPHPVLFPRLESGRSS